MPVEWTALVGPVLTLLSVVAKAAGKAKRYRRKCGLLKDRVDLIAAELRGLEKISQWVPNAPATTSALESLGRVLNRAKTLVESCEREKKAFDFLMAFRNTEEFSFLDKRMTHIMESFHLANRTLLFGLYSDGIFMTVLNTLVGDGACRSLPQEKKDMLETLMAGLSYSSDNMSPEKIRMLELIRSQLKQGSNDDLIQCRDDARSSSSAHSRGGQNLNVEDREVLQDAQRFAEDILEEAEAAASRNKEEVQRVAQLAQQVLYLLPHLRHLQRTRHDETKNLKEELKAALETIKQSSSSSRAAFRCVSPAVINTGVRRKEDELVTHVNRIEESYQNLSFAAMAHITGMLESGNNGA